MDTGQYSEEDLTSMGLLNILNALEFTLEKTYEKKGSTITAQHAVFAKKGFRVHITAWYPNEK